MTFVEIIACYTYQMCGYSMWKVYEIIDIPVLICCFSGIETSWTRWWIWWRSMPTIWRI